MPNPVLGGELGTVVVVVGVGEGAVVAVCASAVPPAVKANTTANSITICFIMIFTSFLLKSFIYNLISLSYTRSVIKRSNVGNRWVRVC